MSRAAEVNDAGEGVGVLMAVCELEGMMVLGGFLIKILPVELITIRITLA